MLRKNALVGLMQKVESGQASHRDVDNLILQQQFNVVRAGQLALADAIELEEALDENAERFLATGDAEQLRPIFE